MWVIKFKPNFLMFGKKKNRFLTAGQQGLKKGGQNRFVSVSRHCVSVCLSMLYMLRTTFSYLYRCINYYCWLSVWQDLISSIYIEIHPFFLFIQDFWSPKSYLEWVKGFSKVFSSLRDVKFLWYKLAIIAVVPDPQGLLSIYYQDSILSYQISSIPCHYKEIAT